jgi:hypothetical protein
VAEHHRLPATRNSPASCASYGFPTRGYGAKNAQKFEKYDHVLESAQQRQPETIPTLILEITGYAADSPRKPGLANADRRANSSMSPILGRSFIAMAGAVVFLSDTVTAHAGPCSADIARLQTIMQSETPILPENPGSLLHHQPTVSDVENAQNQAKAEAAAALDRAQKADAQGDVAACTEAVAELKKLYAID